MAEVKVLPVSCIAGIPLSRTAETPVKDVIVAGVMRSTMLFGNMQFWVSQFLKTVIPMYDIGSAIDIFCLCCQFEHSQKITPVLPIGFLKGLRVLT